MHKSVIANWAEGRTYRISDQEATFADATVPNEQHFEEVVVGVNLILYRHFEFVF